jgi:hypothetical protein
MFTATRRVGSWIKKNLTWGKHPIAATRFFVLSSSHDRTTIPPQFAVSRRTTAGAEPEPNWNPNQLE